MEPPAKKSRKIFEDSESDTDDAQGGVAVPEFKINQDYARRFEYNKKREERQQCMLLLFWFSVF